MTIKKNPLIKNINHVGIIMDGNRRWAKSKGLSYIVGHKRGAEKVKDIIQAAIELKIQFLTLFAFSAENWKRDPSEVNDLMNLLRFFLKNEMSSLKKSGVRVKILGDISLFEDDIKKDINNTISETSSNKSIDLVIAINYGSRQEIVNCIRLLTEKVIENKYKINELDEQLVSKHLYTSGIPDPDLIIRTGGESRLSNFLLWQIAYAELIFISKAWPEFTKDDFIKALEEFTHRERRFGGC